MTSIGRALYKELYNSARSFAASCGRLYRLQTRRVGAAATAAMVNFFDPSPAGEDLRITDGANKQIP